jgi:vacuolar-type H+-ATPase subunit H
MALLRLQVEYIEDNENEAHALADDMIVRYNKILQSQLNELNMELSMAKMSSQGLFEDFFDQNHEFSEKLFEKKKKEIEDTITNIKANIEESKVQKKGWFKQWLKELQELNNMRDLAFLFGGYR